MKNCSANCYTIIDFVFEFRIRFNDTQLIFGDCLANDIGMHVLNDIWHNNSHNAVMPRNVSDGYLGHHLRASACKIGPHFHQWMTNGAHVN